MALPARVPFLLSTGTAGGSLGGVLGKVKCKLGYSKENLFSPSPDLKG